MLAITYTKTRTLIFLSPIALEIHYFKAAYYPSEKVMYSIFLNNNETIFFHNYNDHTLILPVANWDNYLEPNEQTKLTRKLGTDSQMESRMSASGGGG